MVDRIRLDLNGRAMVDQAPTCAAGIASLLHRRYHWTVIEHVLPDGSGLDVLRQAQGRGTEAIVCARSPSMSAAFDAGRLGARGVLLFPEQMRHLSALLSTLTPQFDRRGPPLRRLREALAALSANRADRTQYLTLALRTLADDAKALGHFRRVVSAVRCATNGWTPETIDKLHTALLSADDSGPKNVQAVLAAMTASSLAGSAGLAGACGMTPRSLGHLLTSHTGQGVREWRRLARLRRALIEMGAGESCIGVCAYRAGYPHPQQLTRDCECELGLAPKRVRSLLQAE